MYKLPLPNYNTEDSLSLCIRSMRENRKALFEGARADMARAEQKYIECIQNQEIGQFSHSPCADHQVDNNKFKSLYRYLLLEEGGREVYEHLFSLTSHKFCPYCEYGIVGEVDHFLPRSTHPILAITPQNLIPSCERCNRKKLDFVSNDAEKIFLHPYFEETGADEWLKATVERVQPFVFQYKVVNPGCWPSAFFNRICYQFNLLDLNTIYSAQASAWLDEELDKLYDIRNKGGEDVLKRHLLELAEDRAQISTKSTRFKVWQIPAFKGLAYDTWFCSCGINEIFLLS